jgi:short-subunit dehydrogenase
LESPLAGIGNEAQVERAGFRRAAVLLAARNEKNAATRANTPPIHSSIMFRQQAKSGRRSSKWLPLSSLSSQAKYEVFDYRGSTALVAGASKGIGEAFAEHLAARGVRLVLVAPSVDGLESLAKRLSDKYAVQCVAVHADLADPDVTNSIATELERRGIQVDLLVNNAGSGLIGSFLSHGRKRKEAAIQVNVQALVCLTWLLARGMRGRRRGGIINIASNASFQPLPAMAGYAATKAFVLHFSEALSYDLAAYGVHVMAACPGPTATSVFAGTTTNMSVKSVGSSESMVERTLDAFDQGRTVAYPTRIRVRLGMLSPGVPGQWLVKKIAGMGNVLRRLIRARMGRYARITHTG